MALKGSPNITDIAAAVSTARKARHAIMWQSISVRQSKSTKDKGVRGPMWISRVTFPAAGVNNLLGLVTDSISSLGNGESSHKNYRVPPIVQVPAEWVGWRSGVSAKEPEPRMSEQQKYIALTEDATSSLTILYFFGGNFYTGSPAAYRPVVAKLAELTHGKVLTVGYRLAPQNPFPAALVDVLLAYLCLLYPPPNSNHSPINPAHLIFAGDSAGTSLSLSLIQLILSTRQTQTTTNPTVLFHGRHVHLPLPSGLALLNLTPDQTGSLPSWFANATSDIFADTLPALSPTYPACALWPTDPPRGNLYSEVSMLDHPLVSPVVASSWAGCPPMWVAIGGGERLVDGARFLVQNAARDEVVVVWEEYEMMPHLWQLLFPGWAQSQLVWRNWAEACVSFAEGLQVASSGSVVEVGRLRRRAVDVCTLTRLRMGDVLGYMREHQRTVKPFTGGKAKALL